MLNATTSLTSWGSNSRYPDGADVQVAHTLDPFTVTTYVNLTATDYNPEAYLQYLGADAVMRGSNYCRGRVDFCKIFANDAMVVGDSVVTVNENNARYYCIPYGSPANLGVFWGPGSF
jgi:hypothetical protein